MKKQAVLLPKQYVIYLFSFLGLMLLLGTFFDYQISTALYNEANPFGIFFAAFGEYPAALGFVAAGTLLWLGHNKDNKLKAAAQFLGGAFLIFSGSAMATIMPMLYLDLPTAVIVCIGLACAAAVIFLINFISKSANRDTMLRVAAVIFFVLLFEMLLVNIVKIPWGRVRMRHIAADPRAYFMPWWQAGTELKNTLIAAGVAAEEFKSFPSGHTANSACLMLLGLLPMLCQKLANKKTLLIIIGAVWAMLVAVSRIIMGAHFLTDTVVGFAISLTVMLVICQIVFAKSKQGSGLH